jgi:hypothetical protein
MFIKANNVTTSSANSNQYSLLSLYHKKKSILLLSFLFKSKLSNVTCVWFQNINQKIHLIKDKKNTNRETQFLVGKNPKYFGTGMPSSGSLRTQILTSPIVYFRYQSP